jgi:glycosyltransferase involved in cell wall biosynthesis
MNISVFFPCYNEQDNIADTIERAVKTLEKLADDYEIIAVDDGSTDATYRICSDLSSRNKRIKVIRHAENMGYGAALCTGIKSSRFEAVCFTDADGQFDISELERFLPLLPEFPVVIGTRARRSDSWYRGLNAALFRNLVRLLFGLKVRDLNCGFKVFRRNVFKDIELKSGGAFITAEMLISARDRHYEFTEVYVSHCPRKGGRQTGASPLVVIRAFGELYKFWKDRRKHKPL